MRESSRKFAAFWTPVILWAGAILTLSVIKTPKIEPPEGPVPWDKVWHFCSYAFLTVLALRALRSGSVPLSLYTAVPLSFVVASGYGIIIELIQTLVERDMELADAISNIAGAGVASALYVFLSLRKGKGFCAAHDPQSKENGSERNPENQ